LTYTCFAAADPEGFFIGELDGAPAATVSCVNYGVSFAFLGLYIVRQDLRGRGYGLRIWDWTRDRKLDALDRTIDVQVSRCAKKFNSIWFR
jgi:hypothetical protein